MGKNSKISWTDHTFNPWWGCQRVSPGCQHCYAETLANRFGSWWGPANLRRMFGEKHWNEPLAWNAAAQKAGKAARVFCGSMCDWLEDRPELVEPRGRLVEMIGRTPWLTWMLLTKRPEDLIRLAPRGWRSGLPSNVWLGVTVESQLYVRRMLIPGLFAGIHFVSVEPMLGPVNLGAFWNDVDWVIAGCESGRGRRPMRLDWVRSLRDECQKHHVPFFFKQAEVCGEILELPELDGKVWDEVPEKRSKGKG